MCDFLFKVLPWLVITLVRSFLPGFFPKDHAYQPGNNLTSLPDSWFVQGLDSAKAQTPKVAPKRRTATNLFTLLAIGTNAVEIEPVADDLIARPPGHLLNQILGYVHFEVDDLPAMDTN